MIPLDWEYAHWKQRRAFAPKVPGVYMFSYDRWIPVYVGGTNNLNVRITTHGVNGSMGYDVSRLYAHWLPCELSEIVRLETALIDEHRPIFNKYRPWQLKKWS
jgi:excinuclease UvrABC nuclease subunit